MVATADARREGRKCGVRGIERERITLDNKGQQENDILEKYFLLHVSFILTTTLWFSSGVCSQG